jgi:8-oxo-dGTP pyrophosphatase MutT (NUDIX family)
VTGNGLVREGTSAILIATDGRLLLQLRDDLPHVSNPGKIGLFGGRREDDESFVDCVVREVHEEIGLHLPPERFELIGRYFGPDHFIPGGTRRGEVFVARNVPVDQLTITEGRLRIVALDELERIQDLLATSTKYALEIFLKLQDVYRSSEHDPEGVAFEYPVAS